MPTPGKTKSSNTPKATTSALRTAQAEYGQGWKERFHDITVPSGTLVKVRRSGLAGLMKAGVLESLDSLTGLVQTVTLPKANGVAPVDLKAVAENPETLTTMMDMIDRVVLYVVVEPKILSNYKVDEDGEFVKDESGERVLLTEDEWENGQVYVDDIDLIDKQFIMQYVMGGSSDLATFRAESQKVVGDVPGGEATSPDTE